MHCHVLPGVDDGPKTMDETEAVLKEAVSQGISTMIVTPHYHPDRYMICVAPSEGITTCTLMSFDGSQIAVSGKGLERSHEHLSFHCLHFLKL